MAPKQPERKYQVVVYGGTSFVGKLIVHYLATHYATSGLKWAVAARSQAKLDATLEEQGLRGKVETIIADSTDKSSLSSMVKQTELVISLIGPYILYDGGLVELCAENGTHYVDLTGEAPFVHECIQKHGRTAVSTGALIINACGFDSIPSDLTAFLAVQRLKTNLPNVKIGECRSIVSAKNGSASGGTLATMFNAIENSTKEQRKIAMSPYSLSPVQGKHKPKPVITKGVTFKGKTEYGGFWVMAPFNSQIVRRTQGIFATADPSTKVLDYGEDFSYDEYLKMPGLVSASMFSTMFYFMFAVMAIVPGALRLAKRFLPQPGQGPSEDAQKNGSFQLKTTVKSLDGKHETQVIMRGKGDAGYAATAVMISEAALSIIFERDALPPLAAQGGVLTPAAGLGHVLVERMEKTGRFSWQAQDSKISAKL